MAETITIPKHEYLRLRREVSALRKTSLYKRLLKFEENIRTGKKYARKHLGF